MSQTHEDFTRALQWISWHAIGPEEQKTRHHDALFAHEQAQVKRIQELEGMLKDATTSSLNWERRCAVAESSLATEKYEHAATLEQRDRENAEKTFAYTNWNQTVKELEQLRKQAAEYKSLADVAVRNHNAYVATVVKTFGYDTARKINEAVEVGKCEGEA